MQSFSEAIHPYFDLLRRPNQILNDLDSESIKEILYLWNFIHQQRDILDIENAPKMNEDSDETEDENEIIKKEDKKRLHLDTTFKAVMVYVYHSSFYFNSLAIRMCSLLFYHYFNCSEKCILEYPIQVMQTIPINRFTIPIIFYLTTSDDQFLLFNEVGEIPHVLLFKKVNELIKDYLISPLGQQTAKKTPGSIYMRTRVLGADHKGFIYYLLNGFLISNAKNKWFIFNLPTQIDDLLASLNKNQPDLDLSTQINNFRKYIKTDRKVAQEFAVSKKGMTPSNHYITFSPIKNHSEFDGDTKSILQNAIRDIGWFIIKIEKLAELDRSNKLEQSKVLLETKMVEENVILPNTANVLGEKNSSGSSDEGMVIEEQHKEESERGSEEMDNSNENDGLNEQSEQEESDSSDEKSSGSSSDGSNDSESSDGGSEEDSEEDSSESEEEKSSNKQITSTPPIKHKPTKRIKIRMNKGKVSKRKLEMFEKAYLNEILTVGQNELNEMIDKYSEELALLPLINSKNYKEIINQVINIVSTLISVLPNKYFRKEYVFIRDFIVGLSTKSKSLSFLIVITTLLEKAMIKCEI